MIDWSGADERLIETLDRRIWRVVGGPLIPPLGGGPLAGETLAVKDLYAIAGQRTGAGNPAFLEQAEPHAGHAPVVTSLLAAGASVRGIAQTDEFAYSLAGENIHYGTPPNGRDARRVPGGSSSGPATAVALGQATIGLGTDTAGSIRVPSAYQGLYGFRSTHGAISREGMIPLAPRFDTVGWMTRSASLLDSVGDVLLPPGPIIEQPTIVHVPELMGFADESVADAVSGSLPETAVREDWDLTGLVGWLDAFRTAQAAEAWQSHGGWLGDRLETLGPAVRERFAAAAQIDTVAAELARSGVAEARAQIRELVRDRVLALPAASSVAPLIGHAHQAREATLKLTVLASLGGLPAVTIPLETTSGQPTAVCLVGGRHTDRSLLHLAGRWSQVDH
jgi:Asp-tRNA(Asn)/Glu-tRNA(Gln) amidotransferase A subunit family amidase